MVFVSLHHGHHTNIAAGTCSKHIRAQGQRASPLLARLTGVCQALLAVSCLVAGSMSCCRCRAFVSSLSEHILPEQSGGVPLAGLGPHVDSQPVVCSGSNFTAWVGRWISVLMRGSKGGTVFRSMPLFWRLVFSALPRPSYCADSLLWGRCFRRWCGVRVSWGVPTFKLAWEWLGGPRDSLTDTEKDSSLPDS